MVVLSMALLGALFASTVAAAPVKTDRSIDDRVANQETVCKDLGGTPETYYEFDDDGNLVFAQVSCAGGKLDTRTCINLPTTVECFQFGKLVRPTESVVPGQRPDTAAPVENPQRALPVVDDIVAPPGGVAEDPTGDEQARIVDPAEACRALGGTANVIEQGSRVPAEIRCTGGMLDDMICFGTICDYFRGSAGSEDSTTIPTGEIELVQVESMAELEDAVRGVAEDPTGTDTVVIVNEVASNMVDSATNLVLACEALGGTARVTQDLTVGNGLRSIFVRCTGGLLGGLGCGYLPGGYSACFFRAVLPEDLRVTPAGGIEVPAEDAPTETTVAEPTVAAPDDPAEPTAAPTEPPVEPTAVPTEMPAEPTAAPTEEPVLPTVPTNDNTAPPGEAEEPEPTPTEVVLL